MKKNIFKIISIFIIFIIMFNLVGCKKKKDNHQHDLKYYEKIEATCEKDGNIEYWKCTTCNKYFSDANGEKEVNDVTIKKLGHQYGNVISYNDEVHTKECNICHNKVFEEHTFDENGKCSVCQYELVKEDQDVLVYNLLNDDTYEVVDLNNKNVTKVDIPTYYNNKLVTSIGKLAFYNCDRLETITIPSSVTSIGENAFYECTNLKKINIQSIESWCKIEFNGDNPLLYAHNLYVNGKLIEELEIPDTVDNIPYAAFAGGSFSKVIIPKNTINIGEVAFAYCSNLSSIIVDANNPKYDSRDNCNAIIETSTNELIAGCKNTVISSSVTSINIGAFAGCTSLESITIPSNVTSIREGAFAGCTSLQSVEISSSVISIGEFAFEGCANLKEVTIEEGVTSIGEGAFAGCASLQSITIPSSVASIGSYAFEDCISLQSIVIPFGVTNIGKRAFAGCNLESITIPSSVTSIGEAAFNGCSSLSEINITSIASWCQIDFESGSANPLSNEQAVLKINGEEITTITEDMLKGLISISAYAFYNCNSITKITLPEILTAIGQEAFYGCSSLEEVNITSLSKWLKVEGAYDNLLQYTNTNSLRLNGNKIITITEDMLQGITEIPSNAFRRLENLKSIEIPSSVTSIGQYAFRNCTSLESITIPSSVTSIGESAFFWCISLKEVNITSLASWFKIELDDNYSNPLSNKQAILKIEGQEITNITEEMLEGVTEIPSNAFRNWVNLESIEIPDNVTSIGEYVFSECINLNKVIIGNGITSIKASVFYNCMGLQSITIPSSVISIEEDAFFGCINLNEVNITSLISWFKINFKNEYANPLNNKQAVLKIEGKEITTITEDMLEGITEIPSNAFRGLTSLTSITLPTTITSIGRDAFYGCSSLEEVNITSLASWCQIVFANNYANPLSNKQAILKIEKQEMTTITEDMLEGLTSISAYAFYNCNSITKISLPETLTSIGHEAFYGCSSLEEVNITSLSKWLKVEGIYDNLLQYAKSNALRLNGNEITTITEDMLEGITEIPSNAFRNLTSLTSITLPTTITSIGSCAFVSCTKLECIKIPSSVTSIDSYAFSGCKSLQKIAIPSSLISIGESAFYGCTNLSEVNITSLESWCKIQFVDFDSNPLNNLIAILKINGEKITNITEEMLKGVTNIPERTFHYCVSLQSITIPSSVTSIGEDAFLECINLNEVNITSLVSWCKISFNNFNANPLYVSEQVALKLNGEEITNITEEMLEGLISIGSCAFVGCTKLECIKIPFSVTSIDSYAFFGCSSLQKIVISSSLISIGSNAFEECINLSSIIVDSNNPKYDSRDNCNAIIETSTNTLIVGCKDTIIPSSVTSIGDGAFEYCESLESIIIPFGVTNIGEGAFADCTNLESITIPSSVTSIGYYAFAGCTNLESITIPSSVTSIELFVFAGCTNLNEVTIEKGVISIEESAFEGCISLQSITIPSSVTSIGPYAFLDCTNLTEVIFEDPSNWKVSGNILSSDDLNNSELVASYLTGEYCYLEWTKKTA